MVWLFMWWLQCRFGLKFETEYYIVSQAIGIISCHVITCVWWYGVVYYISCVRTRSWYNWISKSLLCTVIVDLRYYRCIWVHTVFCKYIHLCMCFMVVCIWFGCALWKCDAATLSTMSWPRKYVCIVYFVHILYSLIRLISIMSY